MSEKRKVIVHLYTNWCGEDNYFGAIICDNCKGFEDYCQGRSYENFSEFGGFDAMMHDEFGDPEDEENGYTQEQINEGYDIEASYYGYEYSDYDEESDGDWEWFGEDYICGCK